MAIRTKNADGGTEKHRMPMTFVATEKGKKMINAKGEVIYTNAEIAYELGLSPATVNAIGKRLFGNG
jgi:DNA-binding CsgD family transcriptional regulator